MRAAWIHDGLYHLMREELLDRKKYRKAADWELYRYMIEDGASRIRAWYFYWAVRLFGKSSATNKRKVEVAP
jgi:hypothetical protein